MPISYTTKSFTYLNLVQIKSVDQNTVGISGGGLEANQGPGLEYDQHSSHSSDILCKKPAYPVMLTGMNGGFA
jgi:hypothetical protein